MQTRRLIRRAASRQPRANNSSRDDPRGLLSLSRDGEREGKINPRRLGVRGGAEWSGEGNRKRAIDEIDKREWRSVNLEHKEKTVKASPPSGNDDVIRSHGTSVASPTGSHSTRNRARYILAETKGEERRRRRYEKNPLHSLARYAVLPSALLRENARDDERKRPRERSRAPPRGSQR